MRYFGIKPKTGRYNGREFRVLSTSEDEFYRSLNYVYKTTRDHWIKFGRVDFTFEDFMECYEVITFESEPFNIDLMKIDSQASAST